MVLTQLVSKKDIKHFLITKGKITIGSLIIFYNVKHVLNVSYASVAQKILQKVLHATDVWHTLMTHLELWKIIRDLLVISAFIIKKHPMSLKLNVLKLQLLLTKNATFICKN